MSDDKNKVMDVGGLAKYLNLSKSTVYKLAQEGALPGQKVGKHWRFRQEAVNDWLDSSPPLSREQREKAAAKTSQEPEPQSPDPSAGSPFGNIFSPEQIAVLQERWIETVDQLLSIASTPTGASGLQQVLDLSEEDFINKLRELQSMQGLAGDPGRFAAVRGGAFGLRVDKIHPLEENEKDGEE